ncbi:MAG: hypothetical protein ACO295_03565 [Sediminibacterium sp.]
MINLQNLTVNDDIIIYVNTLDADIPYTTNNFLFGFKNGFTNVWTYVMPLIVTQNTRYTRFSIELVQQQALVDAENGVIQLGPSGNFDYKLWAIDAPTLDPYNGYLLEEGQMYLENVVPETIDITYISDNDPERNIVYLTRDESNCATWSSTDIWIFSTFTWNCGTGAQCVQWPMPGQWQNQTQQWNACTI